MRVLVVDDDDIARELLTSTLRHAGHTVFELSSALGHHAPCSNTQ
jgi:CheY-like chemotaxis protein